VGAARQHRPLQATPNKCAPSGHCNDHCNDRCNPVGHDEAMDFTRGKQHRR